jgi:hypothetical protein
MGSPIAARHQSDDSLCRRPGPAPRCRSFGTAIPSWRAWCEDLLIRRFPCGHLAPFRSVRDLGRLDAGCPCKSDESRGRSSVWLPAWLPAERPAGTANGFQDIRDSLSAPASTGFSVAALQVIEDHSAPRDWPLRPGRAAVFGGRVSPQVGLAVPDRDRRLSEGALLCFAAVRWPTPGVQAAFTYRDSS